MRRIIAAQAVFGSAARAPDHSPGLEVAASAGPDVVRLSIGIEDKEDIIADLDRAQATD
jgi:O-acetylhomoserine/O-acetylserine sulfhydrylase-like pyridoxal-dependent enzyme